MESLHTVTQIRPFILSGGGAFLPIMKGAEKELTALFQKPVNS